MAWVKYQTIGGKRYAQHISIDKETGGIHYGLHLTRVQYRQWTNTGLYVANHKGKQRRLTCDQMQGWRAATAELRDIRNRSGLTDNSIFLSYWGKAWKLFAPRPKVYRKRMARIEAE